MFNGSSITSIIDLEGQNRLLITLMGNHQFRGAMLSGDSSCLVMGTKLYSDGLGFLRNYLCLRCNIMVFMISR